MSDRGARILLATFGSAGDLFPLVPIARRLAEHDHDVRWAVPRSLGLYLRAWHQPLYALGSGAEMRVLEDPSIVTNRFGGWASWRCTMTDYVLPTLTADVERLEQVASQWRPDVVVTMSFAVAARVAARRLGIPLVALSIYPQHVRQLPGSRSFGLAARAEVTRLCGAGGREGCSAADAADLVWGTGTGPLLHDPALLVPGLGWGTDAVGFPSWDAAVGQTDEVDAVARWVERSTKPVVVVTPGSFLGARQHELWTEAGEAAQRLGLRMVFLGPQRFRPDPFAGRQDILSAGFVPLSRLPSRVDLFVHLGGIGTSFGGLRAGRPAVVVPQAFDQSFNATLLAKAGVAVDATATPLAQAIERALGDADLASAARALGRALIPPDVAAAAAVERILAQVEQVRPGMGSRERRTQQHEASEL
jgi:UDP:flavonoid glycosyltransferase YjiC (YdhE family)